MNVSSAGEARDLDVWLDSKLTIIYVLTLIRRVEQHFCTFTIFVTSGNPS